MLNCSQNNTDLTDLERLQKRLRSADCVTRELFLHVVTQACPRCAAALASKAQGHLHHLVQAEAWTDAALVLVNVDLWGWSVRRLAYEDGEWWCTLSKHWQLPYWLDEIVDAHHAVLPFSILSALVEVRRMRRSGSAREVTCRTVPSVPLTCGHAICCDNFA
jgi:hypothetical protein